MNQRLRWPGTLHGRMALAISLLLFFATTVVTAILATQTAQAQIETQQRFGYGLIKLLGNSVERIALRHELGDVAPAMERLGQDPAIASIRITDDQGLTLYRQGREQDSPSWLTRVLAGPILRNPVLSSEISLNGRKGRLELALSYGPINESIHKLVINSALFSSSLLFISIILMYSLLSRFTAPLKPLTEMARQVSRGNWMPRVRLIDSGSREIQELNQAFADGSHTMQHYIRNLEETRELLVQSEMRLRSLIDGMHEILFELDTDARISFLNPAWEKLTGFTIEEALGRPFADFISDPAVADDLAPARLSRVHEKNREINLKTGDGRDLWVSLDGDAQHDTEGNFTGVIGTLADVTQRVELNQLLRSYQEELYYLSVTDPLTGLYNRRHFDTQLEIILTDHLARNESVCLLIIDLDRFKFINDTYGHPFGDEVLNTTARLLKKMVRQNDYVARLAGDEFAMVLKNTSLQEAARIANKLHATLSGAYMDLPIGHLQLQSSIGVAEAPTHGRNVQDLVSAADVALYQSKRRGRNRIEILAPDISKAVMSIFNQGFQLRNALEAGNINPAFQPIVDMTTGKPVAYEVLARMRHDGGVVSAKDFIAVAEELGLTREVDLHIIRQALHTAPADYALFLNISLSSFNDKAFLRQLSELLSQACQGGRDITIEITERATVPITEVLLNDIRSLRRLGCKLALDDFGSGYSTYNFLSYFRPEYLKIEGEFVRGMLENEADYKIVQHIHELAQSFGIATIAESVENEEAMNGLIAIGIRRAQGRYLGAPLLLDLPPTHETATAVDP